ncbi:hypothetical protein DAT35_52445 [Vitiosangium sp. GDMCC 1.1324]|nr:hypothetical protein DAT35_52445 [Vitiosangium sp. GDMCC 1.1324]
MGASHSIGRLRQVRTAWTARAKGASRRRVRNPTDYFLVSVPGRMTKKQLLRLVIIMQGWRTGFDYPQAHSLSSLLPREEGMSREGMSVHAHSSAVALGSTMPHSLIL